MDFPVEIPPHPEGCGCVNCLGRALRAALALLEAGDTAEARTVLEAAVVLADREAELVELEGMAASDFRAGDPLDPLLRAADFVRVARAEGWTVTPASGIADRLGALEREQDRYRDRHLRLSHPSGARIHCPLVPLRPWSRWLARNQLRRSVLSHTGGR